MKATDIIPETKACGVYGFSACNTNREKLRKLVTHTVEHRHGKTFRYYLAADVLEARKKRYAAPILPKP
jgi:hypothetical protein